MQVILIESAAFYKLLEMAVEHLNTRSAQETKNREEKSTAEWLTLSEAMKILPYRSRSKWQQLRDGGTIVFSQFGRKLLYSKKSLLEYISKNKIKP